MSQLSTNTTRRRVKVYEDAAKKHGIELLDYGMTGGGHLWLICKGQSNIPRKLFVAYSPSDHRAIKNFASVARRVCG